MWYNLKAQNIIGRNNWLEKTERVLYIYTRLLHGMKLNKSELAHKLNVNERSIQRDFSDINNFIFEDDTWVDQKAKVAYDTTTAMHSLQTIPIKIRKQMIIALLYQMKETLPFIQEESYRFLKQYSLSNQHHKWYIHNLLNNFQVSTNKIFSETLIEATQCINNKFNINIHTSQNTTIYVSPLYIHYIDDNYWLTYIYNSTISSIRFSDIVKLTSTTISYDISIMQLTNIVTIQCDNSLWHCLQNEYVILDYDSTENFKTAEVIMSQIECLSVAKRFPQKIKIISPQNYKEAYINHLTAALAHYSS